MEKLEKSVPVIRFKGFSEAWEQRKLGEVFTERSEKSNKGELISVTISSGVIKASELERKDNSSSDKSNYKVVKKGDIAYNSMRMWQGASGHSLFDGILSPAYTIITPKKNISSKFISYIFKKHNMIQNFQRRSQGLTSDTWNLKFLALSGIKVEIPNYTEQAKISDFFQHIDNTIALHQRKLDSLKLMKKGLLQQMFPKRGENIPKIRFDDFDDIWEQRILGEFLKESKIKGSNGSLAKKLTVKLWRKGVVPKEEIYTGSSATQYYIRKTGQFMYGKLDFLNQAFGIVPLELDGYESTLDSPAFDIEESINETFLLEYVSLVRFYKYQGNIANGSRRAKRIHTDTFFEMPIPLPNSNEQQKIGTFSQQIDDLIALQQNKLEKLSSLKKSYLQNMFI
ncbi:restriction endonuclease subunit S [Listeria sp. FSL L7-1425]|uniref:restriction endonuclease subunit S n=1 Tax=Listeria cossartiae TaxID=2838249 RepID=UPI0016242AD4|nr:restriction endonuclease subunit S [Listeria cossartiae]MBC1567974.1 restriction endonuclease subunit S [Listeria cossartiae subsp. cossartiae]